MADHIFLIPFQIETSNDQRLSDLSDGFIFFSQNRINLNIRLQVAVVEMSWKGNTNEQRGMRISESETGRGTDYVSISKVVQQEHIKSHYTTR